MSSTTHRVATAVEKLKQAVLGDAALRKIASEAKTPSDLERLWSIPAFRQVHATMLEGISVDDVKEYAAELRDDQLEAVAGGVLADASITFNANLSPREVYATVFFGALKGSIAPSG